MRLIACLLVLSLLPAVLAVEVDVLKTDPAPLVAGEYADVTVRFTKEDGDTFAEPARFVIEESPFIVPVSERELSLAAFRSGDEVTHTFRLFLDERLPEGYVDLPAAIVTDGGELNADLRVFVQEAESVPEIYVGSVVTTPDELLPDTDDNELVVTLQNLGDKDAELVRAELVPRGTAVTPSFAYSFEDSVASIEAGGEAEFTFTADLDEEARGELAAELVLRYRSRNAVGERYDTYEERVPFVIPVADAPLLSIAEVELLDRFRAGSAENRVRITILNEGAEEAEEVRARAQPDISYPFIFELTTEYVASKIPPGGTATVVFTMEVLKSAEARDYPITVSLESLVGEARYAREQSMTVTTRGGDGVSTRTLAFAIIAVVVVTSLVIGLRGRGKGGKRRA